MKIFTFDQIYNVVRAQVLANSSNGVLNDWADIYPEADTIYKLIEKLPKNNSFESDIINVAKLMDSNFAELNDIDDPEELQEIHYNIMAKFPKVLDKYTI